MYSRTRSAGESPEGPGTPAAALPSLLYERLRARLSPRDYETWFRRTPCSLDPPASFVLTTQSPFHRKWMETKYGEIVTALARELSSPYASVRFEVASSQPATVASDAGRCGASCEASEGDQGLQATLGVAAEPALPCGPLHAAFSLERFVVGPASRVAHAAITAVAEGPGKTYNPVIIYGPAGTGKSHLLQGLARHLCQTAPLQVVYTTAEGFTNQYITAAEARDLESFRHPYREADVLLVDDIQFLAGKPKTLQELLGTVETLHRDGRQVVLSSACEPGALAGFPPRLLAACRSGLSVRIDPPDFESRVAIAIAKARAKGARLPRETAEYLAHHVHGNARELEGAVSSLIHMAELCHSELTLDAARTTVGELLTFESSHRATRVGIDAIIAAVLERYGVGLRDLLSPKKVRTVVRARHAGMYLARELTPLSLEQIGAQFGGRDHTTVLYAVRCMRRDLDQKPQLRMELALLKARIAGTSRI